MILGVPTLNRYDLLARLFASAEAGSCKPERYLVVDNGGQFGERHRSMPAVAAALARGATVEVLAPGKNLGVAASWNAILDRAGDAPVVVASDDVELGDGALEALARAVGAHDFVIADGGYNASGWCLFAQTPACTRAVGYYDENFYPAYCEDSDYDQRLRLAGIAVHREPVAIEHVGWATMRVDPTVMDGQRASEVYFRRKWGAAPTEPDKLYERPFDGAPGPPLRCPSQAGKWVKLDMKRYDVVNRILEKIGGDRYLEIGGSAQGTLCAVRARVRVIVDPEPHPDGAAVATAVHAVRSDAYFASHDDRFDVAFIDGLHHADQAYRDIAGGLRVARVVVVHDANPSTEAMQVVPVVQGEWTGDVWKAVARLRAEGRHAVRTVDVDYGVAVVVPDRWERVAELPRATWDDLVRHRVDLLGLVSPGDWEGWFDGVWDVGRYAFG